MIGSAFDIGGDIVVWVVITDSERDLESNSDTMGLIESLCFLSI